MKKAETLEKLFLFFVMYSVIGWCYEVFLEVVVYGWGFTNRGVLFGPYCPVYGVGALLFILCFYNTVKKNKNINILLRILIVFIGTMAVATLVELVASYIMEFFTGHWLWETYKNYKYNFQGRIALSTSIRFGIGGTIFLFLIQPLFDKLLSKIPTKVLTAITASVATVLCADMVYTFLIK
ncbi:MAG: putative ABC transporter permease [Acutalibacteraceae bacterium]